MNQTILPGPRTGRVTVPASKSYAHRFFIAAVLSRAPVTIHCRGVCGDIRATLSCLQALGADIREIAPETYEVAPLLAPRRKPCILPCQESGATLRFLLPLVGALGINAVFHREGRLPQRPLEPLLAELVRHGMSATADGCDLHCQGQLRSGDYVLPGDVSSQFVSALLLALPLLPGDSTLTLTSAPESAPYIAMTEEVLAAAGISLYRTGSRYRIPGGQRYRLSSHLTVEGDWSSAAFFLCAGAMSREGIAVDGLSLPTRQGDSALLPLLRQMGAEVNLSSGCITVRKGRLRATDIDARPIPDLIPPLSVLAAAAEGGSHIQNARRLRYKESDRLQGIAELLNSLGGCLTVDGDSLLIHGVSHLRGGTVDPMGDHRLAMSAALAALSADAPVTVRDADCVSKSYPAFWADFQSLKGEAPCPAPSETPSV